MGRTFSLCFWNVRGLGDTEKCNDVLAELLSSSRHIALLQETKLSELTSTKLYSFLPRSLHAFHSLPATGSSGGLLTAWNTASFTCNHYSHTRSTLTVHLTETSSNLNFAIINVYALSVPELRLPFLQELKDIAPQENTP